MAAALAVPVHATPAKRQRRDLTVVRNVVKATPASTWQLAQTEEGRHAILKQYDQDTHTAAGHGVRAALMNTWDSIHHLWTPCEPVLPLTPSKIRNVAAHMKHAGYRSWPNYASRIREAHINAGFIISPQLELAFRAARRSVLRGIGPSKQAMSLDLAAAAALDGDDVIITKAMPIAGVSVFIMAAFFLLREIEMAALCFCHVVTDKAKECVTLELSISKADPDARGCRRAWGVPMRRRPYRALPISRLAPRPCCIHCGIRPASR